jgi:hypothetical protein
MEFISTSKEDMDKFYAMVAADAVKEAQKLDAQRYPCTKIFNEVQRLI